MKRKLLAGLLTLCMAAGMAVPAAAATTPAEQEPGADGPKYTHVDHVLNEDTHRNNMDILVMARVSPHSPTWIFTRAIACVSRRTESGSI